MCIATVTSFYSCFTFIIFYTLVCRKIALVANVICLWKPTLNKVSCILYNTIRGYPDQTPHSVASDLGLHCFPMFRRKDAWLKWVKIKLLFT